MKNHGKKELSKGILFITLFAVWTMLLQIVDKQPLGQNKTNIGFATINCWFHKFIGVHMTLYYITDWMGLIPLFVCAIFACIGLYQLIKRKSLFKVDRDIIVLGIYYVVVILCYILFEMFPVNYRPVLINGILEASYPSSTTLLVITVMPTLMEQASRRVKDKRLCRMIAAISVVFSLFMVCGRLISGVHWLTDIIGSVLLSVGLFCVYKAFVLFCLKK